MQRGRGRGRRAWNAGGRGGGRGGGGPPQGGGGQDFAQPGMGGPGGMGGNYGDMGPPMGGPNMGPNWGPNPAMGGGPGMMGGPGMGPGMMGGPPGMLPGPPMGGPGGMMGGPGGMMGAPMDGPGMPPFGFPDDGPPGKRMRHMGGMPGDAGGPMGGGFQPPPQQQQVQHPGRPGWAGSAANDYCQHFVDTGLRPQNYLGELLVDDPLDEYPMLKELRDSKKAQVSQYYTPPYGIRTDLKRIKLSPELFGTKFDVILIDPPWEEYVRRAPGFIKDKDKDCWAWQEIKALDVGAIADSPSFVFLWCGCEEGIDAGRHCLEQWGFRRIEDICWIKTNRQHDQEPGRKYLAAQHQSQASILVHTKEHCLVGLKGKLNRSIDGAFVHANCDTDIIFSEEPPLGSTEKPAELYDIIERFCNGRRRLELFGDDNNMRPGWVTVGKDISSTNFKKEVYCDHFRDDKNRVYTSHGGIPPREGAPVLVPSTDVIERNRPKSPPPMRPKGHMR